MKCPNCGSITKDGFCEYCGNDLHSDKKPDVVINNYYSAPQYTPVVTPPVPHTISVVPPVAASLPIQKKRKKPVFILIAIFAPLIVVGIIIAAISGAFSNIEKYVPTENIKDTTKDFTINPFKNPNQILADQAFVVDGKTVYMRHVNLQITSKNYRYSDVYLIIIAELENGELIYEKSYELGEFAKGETKIFTERISITSTKDSFNIKYYLDGNRWH